MGPQLATLSSKARLKGRILYFGFFLQMANTAVASITLKSDFKLSAFYTLMTAISAIVLYQFRPSSLQSLIDKWSQGGHLPIKSRTLKKLRIVMSIGFLTSFFQLVSRAPLVSVREIITTALAVPLLAFVFDDEIFRFLGKENEAEEKVTRLESSSNGLFFFSVFVVALVLLVFIAKKGLHQIATSPAPQVVTPAKSIPTQALHPSVCRLSGEKEQENGFVLKGASISGADCLRYCQRLRDAWKAKGHNPDLVNCFLNGNVISTL
ncbi:MAG: hypothetical protein NDI61_06295 [Bdellovibrionaceae bacterium]|nr:hypothetical protein [Pseudobdellovibrionaceae bacterium]